MSGYRFDRLKILVVQDHAHARRLVATMLQAFGVSQVYEAANVQQAWTILRRAVPDLVVLDWDFGDKAGTELMRTIRTNPLSPNPFVPVIMLATSRDQIPQARDCGVNEFIAKPLSVQMLMSRLVAVIEHPRTFVRAEGYFGPCRRRLHSGEYLGAERRASADDSAKTRQPMAAV